MSVQLSSKDVLESLDREISTYRKRLDWLYPYSLVAIALVVTGEQRISLINPIISKSFFTLIFVGVAFSAISFCHAYRRRVYSVREKRVEILERSGFNGVYLKHEEHVSVSPSLIFIIAVSFASILGIAITWLSV